MSHPNFQQVDLSGNRVREELTSSKQPFNLLSLSLSLNIERAVGQSPQIDH
jgi:hypothetical protein